MPNAPVELGETFSYSFQAKDSAGASIVPGSATVVVTRPDGTAGTTTVTGLSPVLVSHLTTQVGTHVITGSVTGGALGTDVRAFEDVFTVEPVGRYLVGVDEALSHLAAAATITSTPSVEQLRWYILAASDAVERDLGRAVARRVVTAEKHWGGTGWLRLRRTPVQSVTNAVENGVTLTGGEGVDYTLDVNEGTGLLFRGSPTSPKTWATGRHTVTYVAGASSSEPVLRKVVLNAVQAMWQTSQQRGHPLLDDVTADGAVFVAANSLSSVELAGYDSHRVAGLA